MDDGDLLIRRHRRPLPGDQDPTHNPIKPVQEHPKEPPLSLHLLLVPHFLQLLLPRIELQQLLGQPGPRLHQPHTLPNPEVKLAPHQVVFVDQALLERGVVKAQEGQLFGGLLKAVEVGGY